MANLFSAIKLNKIKSLYNDMFDTFSKECRLYYPPLITNCSSCLKLVTNDFQGNVNVHGDNISNFGGCDYCGGTGKIEQEVTDTVNMVCNWTPKNFKNLFQNVNLSQVDLITKCKISDAMKVRRCIYMMINPKLEPIIPHKYKLFSEGSDQYCITQGDWFFQLWNSA